MKCFMSHIKVSIDNTVDPHQYAYRKSRSTSDAISSVPTTVKEEDDDVNIAAYPVLKTVISVFTEISLSAVGTEERLEKSACDVHIRLECAAVRYLIERCLEAEGSACQCSGPDGESVPEASAVGGQRVGVCPAISRLPVRFQGCLSLSFVSLGKTLHQTRLLTVVRRADGSKWLPRFCPTAQRQLWLQSRDESRLIPIWTFIQDHQSSGEAEEETAALTKSRLYLVGLGVFVGLVTGTLIYMSVRMVTVLENINDLTTNKRQLLVETRIMEGQINALTLEIDKVSIKVNKQQEDINDLRTEKRKLTEHGKITKNQELSRMSQAGEELFRKKEELNRIRNTLQLVNGDRALLRREMEELSRETEELSQKRDELNQLYKEKDELSHARDKLTQEIKRLTQERDKLSQEREELKETLEFIQKFDTFSVKDNCPNKMGIKMTGQQKSVNDLTTEKKKLVKERTMIKIRKLDQMSQEGEEMFRNKEELDRVRAEMSQAMEDIGHLSAEKDNFLLKRDKLSQLRAERTKVSQVKDELSQEKHRLIQERDELTRQIKKLSQEREELKETLEFIQKFDTFSVKDNCLNKICKPCTAEWILFKQKCYLFYDKPAPWKTWEESRTLCKRRGADLVVIDDLQEQDSSSCWQRRYAADDMPTVLTPAKLLTPRIDLVLPPPGQCDLNDLYRKQIQALANAFRKRWHQEYLTSLQPRQKRHVEKPNLSEGHDVSRETSGPS
ncbi:hypothetical protein CCH79_00020447 [Gambusia affinis]|uniref:Uncharacterized protein n=1 Tax=Gambusia affinis TaxID=33528 RepID=A0A315V4P6_GAMAF|nr:hypothetical protein CCH79_00020447 [Gambusia affinis]